MPSPDQCASTAVATFRIRPRVHLQTAREARDAGSVSMFSPEDRGPQRSVTEFTDSMICPMYVLLNGARFHDLRRQPLEFVLAQGILDVEHRIVG